jgi:hypothetical protein
MPPEHRVGAEGHEEAGALPEEATGHGNSTGPRSEEAHSKAAVASAKNGRCTRSVNERAEPTHQKESVPIEFSVHESDPVLNFGVDRNTKRDVVVLKGSRKIPPGIESKNFEIDSVEPLRRIGTAELESTRLHSPRYSRPHFINHRKELVFSLCVKATDGEAGIYTGQFLFAGPGLISSVTLTQTAQLKDGSGKFLPFFIVIVLVTLIALAVRAYTEFEGKPQVKEFVAAGVVVIGSAGAAALAMFLLYEETPTWGEKGTVVAGAALVAAAFTAAGLGAVLGGGSPKIVSALQAIEDAHKSRKPDGNTEIAAAPEGRADVEDQAD